MTKCVFGKIALLIFACVLAVGTGGAEQPLSKDDVTLLLIGGATSEKMVALIEQRGVDFKMTPEFAKKFRDAGAGDAVIGALQEAGAKLAPKGAGVTPAAPASTPGSTAAPNPSPAALEAKPAGSAATSPAGATPSPSPKAKSAGGVDLSDPSPDRTQQIVQEFAAKEQLFKLARNNYAYHQINKVETLDPDGNVDGLYQQEWDILYDDTGKRIERVTYAPVDTLTRVQVTPEDLNAMRNIQPFVLTSDELPEYDIKYLGHVKLDEITAYVFSIRPKEIKKGQQYFQGTVWVDDRDLQIVKSQGKNVPELKTRKGENLFPRFTTYREQIDGKFWFPTFTLADDTLYFSGGPVHIKQIIKYTDYKQFKASSTVRMVGELPRDKQPSAPTTSPPPKPK